MQPRRNKKDSSLLESHFVEEAFSSEGKHRQITVKHAANYTQADPAGKVMSGLKVIP